MAVIFYWPLTLVCSGGLAKSTLSLFHHNDRFDFVIKLRIGTYYANQTFYVFFVLRIGTQGEVCILLNILRQWSRCCSYSV